jgi:hypothetical protein
MKTGDFARDTVKECNGAFTTNLGQQSAVSKCFRDELKAENFCDDKIGQRSKT